MKKFYLEQDVILYCIPSEHEGKLGTNIITLINGKEALVIDAGYRKQFSLVLEDLRNQKIKCTAVIPTHYHPDHIEGILLLEEPEIYGNTDAENTLSLFYSNEEIASLKPTKTLDDGITLKFGRFDISFANAPGHSNCSMLIFINDSFIHAGDLYIRTDSGIDVLPYVKWKGIKDHMESLLKIQANLSGRKLLLSHGECPLDNDEALEGINNRISYMQSLLDSDNSISVYEALADCTKPFEFLQWRDEVR